MRLVVASYVRMPMLELRGRRFVKAHGNRTPREALDDRSTASMERSASAPRLGAVDGILVERPVLPPARGVAEPRAPRLSKRDYLAIEAAKRSLGLAGERFVLEFERVRLRDAGRARLAERVGRVAETRGDGAGYDIPSFDPDGRERHVEVKTTSYAAETPFFVNVDESRFARANDASFALARVFDFRRQPRFFELPGDLHATCPLDPVTYRASPASSRST